MNYYTKNEKHKIQTAVALGYNQELDVAPRILATGKGNIAEKILAIASQENIPVHQDAELAEMLNLLELNSIIPIEAYAAIAKILTHIYGYNIQNAK
jgi:flagellar biosynthesis protein